MLVSILDRGKIETVMGVEAYIRYEISRKQYEKKIFFDGNFTCSFNVEL